MSTHRKDFIFKIWYRNQVNWLGTVKNHCVCTKDATFPPDGLFFKAEQRTSTCTFIYFGCVWFFSVFYTQNILADLSWMRLAEEMGKKKKWQGEDVRLRRAACDVENGNGDESRPNSETLSPVQTWGRNTTLLQTIVLSDRVVGSGASKCI